MPTSAARDADRPDGQRGPWPRAVAGLPPAIGSHRLVADGRTCALLTPEAEVDWWCAPELDAPPVLWSLLDHGGARAAWQGARFVDRSSEPAGPTARTVLSVGGRRIEVWDGLLAVDGGGSALVRVVRALDEPVEVVHELSLGGFDGPVARWSGHRATVGGVDVHVTGGVTEVGDDGMARTRLQAGPGWAATVISCGGAVDADPDRLTAALVAADAAHRAGLDAARLPEHHPERARDALAVLEACTDGRTGAVVASPTTSLPEAPGADRQFDYRYTWLRDASLAVSVASLLGHAGAAERYLSFVHELAGDALVPARPMGDIRGGPVPEEREVDGVGGWGGSRPVRVGNAAADQLQLDALGLLLEAISVYVQTGGRLDDRTWRLVSAVADHLTGPDVPPSSGIWELREPRQLVSADIGRWIALDRAVWMGRLHQPLRTGGRRRWKRARDDARDRVLSALGPDGSLPQAHGDDHRRLDASGLMAVVFGLLDGDDPRATDLVDATIAGLGAGALLFRYEPGTQDGFAGQEGAFVPVAWWAAAALAKTGRLAEAQARVDELCATLPRLLSEEVDPATGTSLGNVPLVWSHMEAARTMYLLDAEARRSRHGTIGLSLWRVARYLRLRRDHRSDGPDRPGTPVLQPGTRPPWQDPGP